MAKTLSAQLAEVEAENVKLRNMLAAGNQHRSELERKFETMMRRSEAMRNRQIEIINRLTKGGTIPEEMQTLQQENAALVVERDDLQARVATLLGDRSMLSEMFSPQRAGSIPLSDQLSDTPKAYSLGKKEGS